MVISPLAERIMAIIFKVRVFIIEEWGWGSLFNCQQNEAPLQCSYFWTVQMNLKKKII